MSESSRRAIGRKLVSRADAQALGTVDHLLVDAGQRRIAAVIIGRGKKARLVDWSALAGFGPDAVMVSALDALRPPANDREDAAAHGKLDLVGRRALTDEGNELGHVDDLTFDPETGTLESLLIGDRQIPATALLGSGTYAAVLDAAAGTPPG